MPTELPYAADAEEALSYDELEVSTPSCGSHAASPNTLRVAHSNDHPHVRPLQVLRLQYQKELSQSHVTVQTKFNYAWGLVKSPLREHQVEGVRLLQGAYQYQFRNMPLPVRPTHDPPSLSSAPAFVRNSRSVCVCRDLPR
uniref:DNA ligase (EC) n=1 Tax=Ganoderma boninense TaxID=34458 RepID=A0A5K1JSX1_9APHY|nr:DNA ligase (EC [Ganoderma boninense]